MVGNARDRPLHQRMSGQKVSGVDFPSGYAEVDELLRQYGKSVTT